MSDFISYWVDPNGKMIDISKNPEPMDDHMCWFVRNILKPEDLYPRFGSKTYQLYKNDEFLYEMVGGVYSMYGYAFARHWVRMYVYVPFHQISIDFSTQGKSWKQALNEKQKTSIFTYAIEHEYPIKVADRDEVIYEPPQYDTETKP